MREDNYSRDLNICRKGSIDYPMMSSLPRPKTIISIVSSVTPMATSQPPPRKDISVVTSRI